MTRLDLDSSAPGADDPEGAFLGQRVQALDQVRVREAHRGVHREEAQGEEVRRGRGMGRTGYLMCSVLKRATNFVVLSGLQGL